MGVRGPHILSEFGVVGGSGRGLGQLWRFWDENIGGWRRSGNGCCISGNHREVLINLDVRTYN